MRRHAAISLVGALAACGNSSGSSSFPSHGAAAQDASLVDAAGQDATDADTCVTDGSAGYLCYESLAGYCAKWDASSCGTTWQGVRQPAGSPERHDGRQRAALRVVEVTDPGVDPTHRHHV